MKKLQAFSCLPHQQFHCEKKHDIYFSDEKIYAQYRYCSASFSILYDCVIHELLIIVTLNYRIIASYNRGNGLKKPS